MPVKFFSLISKAGAFTRLMIISILIAVTGCSDGGDDDGIRTIVCFGDSITEGMSAVTVGVADKTKSYPAYLQEKVSAIVINSGVSGDATTDANLRAETDLYMYDPDVAVICLGANDIFDASLPAIVSGTAVKTIRANLTRYITRLDDSDRLIFIAKFYSEQSARDVMAARGGVTDPAIQTAVIKSLDDMFDSIAGMSTSRAKVILIDNIWDDVWGTSGMSSDGIHPAASGYEIMADNYFRSMESYLEDIGLLK